VGALDELAVVPGLGGLVADGEVRRVGIGRVQRADVPVAAGDEELRATEVGREIRRVVRRPHGPLRGRIAEQRERVVPVRRVVRLQQPRRERSGRDRLAQTLDTPSRWLVERVWQLRVIPEGPVLDAVLLCRDGTRG
jgi:hypothetical protein